MCACCTLLVRLLLSMAFVDVFKRALTVSATALGCLIASTSLGAQSQQNAASAHHHSARASSDILSAPYLWNASPYFLNPVATLEGWQSKRVFELSTPQPAPLNDRPHLRLVSTHRTVTKAKKQPAAWQYRRGTLWRSRPAHRGSHGHLFGP